MCGLPGASSTIERLAVREPTAVGVKLSAIAQLAPTASDEPQLFTPVKSPPVVMLAIASAPVPMFVTYTNCGGVVVDTVWLGNVSDVGTTAIPEPAALGVTILGAATVGCAAGAVAPERAVVEIVSRVVTGPLRGVTVGGLKSQVVCGGRLPLAQLSVISLLYGPFCGVMVTV